MSNRNAQQSGFTLIETVVSMLILAIMSVMSYQALESVLNVNQRSQTTFAEETRLQFAWQIIGNDLLHIRPRPFSDGLGGIQEAYATQKYGALVNFSRGGSPLISSNPSGLHRVSYELNNNNELFRHALPVYLSPRVTEQHSHLLLRNVKKISFEQLSEDYYYRPEWPPLNIDGDLLLLPKMIKVTILLNDGNSTSRVYPGVDTNAS